MADMILINSTIQYKNATIAFTMVNAINNITKLQKHLVILKREDDGCVDKYVICYGWKNVIQREQTFKAFEIIFNPIKSDTTTYQ